jgi:hypothetical protein
MESGMTNLPAVEAFREAFGAAFGSPPDLIARAPGRVNLIGEHTDYNDGFVMPMAIDREVRVAVRRRADRLVRLVSVNYHAHSEFSLDEVVHDPDQTWSNYERGVVQILLDSGASLGGFDMAIVGDVPEGAGLSSSAAVEVATLTALNSLFGLGLAPFEVAKLGQRAGSTAKRVPGRARPACLRPRLARPRPPPPPSRRRPPASTRPCAWVGAKPRTAPSSRPQPARSTACCSRPAARCGGAAARRAGACLAHQEAPSSPPRPSG